MDRLKSRDLWIGIVAGIIVALAGAFGVTLDGAEVSDALGDIADEVTEPPEGEPDSDTEAAPE